MATITGTSGNDTLFGSPSTKEDDEFIITTGNDVINGLGGENYLFFNGLAGPVNVNFATGIATFGGTNTTTFSNINGGLGSLGNDTMIGSDRDEAMAGSLGNDSMDGGGGNDFLVFQTASGGVQVNLAAAPGALNVTGADGNDTVTGFENVVGSDFADSITGSSDNNLIEGGGGNDTLRGGNGIDTLSYDNANGAVQVNLQTSVVGGAAGADNIGEFENVIGSGYNDSIVGDGQDNLIEGGFGSDTLDGGGGFNTLDYRNAASNINAHLGNGTVQGGAAGTDVVSNFAGVLGTAFNDTMSGGTTAVKLEGLGGDDQLFGSSGNDTLLGGAGSDFIMGNLGNDTIDGGASRDYYFGNDLNSISYNNSTGSVYINMTSVTGDGSVGVGMASDGLGGVDTLSNVHLFTGSNQNDTILGSSAAIFEQFEGGLGDDVLNGGAYDLIFLDGFNRVSYQNSPGAVTVDLRAGLATGASGTDILVNFHGVRTGAHADTLLGSDTTLFTEQFEGRGGNDTIDGRGGSDVVRYGYVSNNTSTGIYANLATGIVIAGVGDIDTLINIERVRGSQYNDTLIGGNPDFGADVTDGFEAFRGDAGNDWIDGGAGFDQVEYGTATSGVYVVLGGTGAGFAYDGQGGIDTLINIEQVAGSYYDDYLVGSDTAPFESFDGQIGNDTIDGRGGIDRVTYSGSRAGVTINLAEGFAIEYTAYGGTTMGRDTLLNIEWARGSEVFENGAGDLMIGNAEANNFQGLGGNDTLDGGAGIDTLEGGNGSDTYIVRDVGDVVIETNALRATGGDDTVISHVTAAMSTIGVVLGSYVEILRIGTTLAANGAGNSLNNTIIANLGNNVLDGAGGIDTISFELATTAVVASIDSAMTGAQATGGSGSDTLLNFENITGGSGNDSLTGSAAGNVLSGGLGADTLVGGLGNDIYVVDSDADVVVETSTAPQEIDEIQSSVTYSLSALANVENLTLTGNNFASAFGNDLANVLTGNNNANSLIGAGGNDTLDGGLGSDTMIGGAGNDVYVVDAANDRVIELFNDGIDLIRSAVTFSLVDTNPGGANGSNVENLSLIGNGNINGTGNVLDNVIYAGNGDNVIDGVSGNDTVSYANSARAVTVSLSLIGTQATIGSGSDNLINIDNLEGSAFNDTLTGDANANRLVGLAGNDTFLLLSGNDTVLGGEGADTIFAGGVGNASIDGGLVTDQVNGIDMNLINYSQSATALIVNWSGITGDGSTGSGTVNKGVNGTDTLVNVNQIVGSNFNDSITGSSAMTWEYFEGGAGDDTINGGVITDTVNFVNSNRISYGGAAGAVVVNLETGIVTGGAGNDLISNFNELIGSGFNDSLTGSDFAFEQFEGRAGNDTIDGGGGRDRVRYNSANSAVYVDLAHGYALDGLGGRDTLLNIEMVAGSRFNDTLLGGNVLNGVGVNDGFEAFRGGAGNDTIDGGAGFDRAEYNTATDGVIVTLGGSGIGIAYDGQGGVDTLINIEGVRGSYFNDLLKGSDSSVGEVLEGLDGNDTLNGGLGNDTLTGGLGRDTFVLATGSTDTVTDFTAGNGGDILDLAAIIASLTNTVAGASPFATGHLRLTQSGANTLVEADSDGVVGVGAFQTVAILNNVSKVNITSANLAGGLSPAGKQYSDFDGDGKSDIMWRNTATGAETIWKSANSSTVQVVGTLGDQNWKIVGLGDFDGDSKTDLLWRNTTNGVNTIWKSGNIATTQGVAQVADLAWKVVGVGDFDGDSKSDILWRNTSSGANAIWKSANSATAQGVAGLADQAWKVAGIGDFDGDGKSDILWRNSSTGGNAIWKSANVATAQAVAGVADQTWKIAGVGDFDGDGRSDILWRNTSSGINAIWKSANSATVQTVAPLSDQNWQVVGTGDYDGDGKSDIHWHNIAGGGNAVWRSGNSATVLSVSNQVDLNWKAIDGLESGDLLNGGPGANTLYGTLGNDTLFGAAGADSLTGGLGQDVFRYNNPAEGNDSITDFVVGTDKLQFLSAAFSGLAVGTLGAGSFVSGAAPAPTQAAAQFLYNTSNGQLSFDADGTGGTAAVNIVTLVGNPVLSAADILIGS